MREREWVREMERGEVMVRVRVMVMVNGFGLRIRVGVKG